jgi:hypothetical protein
MINSSHVHRTPHPPAAVQTVAGLRITPKPCPKCGGKTYEVACKCPQRRLGWKRCAKCLNPKCATIIKW